MPRDGSNIYSPPAGTNGTPNYTIESTKYNNYVADVAQDLNLPRPIVAGGTGASDAHTAMVNLSGEITNQLVTNYDTFPFVPGSFYSEGSATGSPVAGQGFSGICYQRADGTQMMTLEARCWSDSLNPGAKYVRQKISGTWQAWTIQPGSTADLDARYVNVTGDTMTGALTVVGGITSASTASMGTYLFGTSTTKFLQYDGTNFNLSGGILAVGGDVIVKAGSPSGSLFFGNSGTKYLQYDGTNFNLAGGELHVNSNLFSNLSVYSGYVGATGYYFFGNSGTKYLQYDGANFNLVGGILNATSYIQAPELHSNGDVYVGLGTSSAVLRFSASYASKYLQYDGTNFNFAGGNLQVYGSVVQASAAGTTYNLDGVTNTVSAANGAVIIIVQNFSGVVIVNAWTGVCEMFICGGGSVNRVSSAGGTTSIAGAYASAQNGYYFVNNTGGTATFGIIALRTRTTA